MSKTKCRQFLPLVNFIVLELQSKLDHSVSTSKYCHYRCTPLSLLPLLSMLVLDATLVAFMFMVMLYVAKLLWKSRSRAQRPTPMTTTSSLSVDAPPSRLAQATDRRRFAFCVIQFQRYLQLTQFHRGTTRNHIPLSLIIAECGRRWRNVGWIRRQKIQAAGGRQQYNIVAVDSSSRSAAAAERVEILLL